MAESPDQEGRAESGHGGWPAWLDEDDFDGLGKDAWLAAMEALSEEGPEPECPPDASVRDGGSQPGGDALDDDDPDDYLPDDGRPGGDGLSDDLDWPVLGFGPGDAGESMPPGVSLSMLAEHTVTSGGLAVMSDYEVIGLVAAARRQRNRSDWLELQAIREFTRRRWESGAVPVRDENGRWLFKNSSAEQAADELAFHLADSRAQAEDRMELSVALRDRLPKLDALLAAGRLDDRRVQAVADITAGLTLEQARQVDELLAPDAAGLGYTALRRRAAKLAMSLSPEAERKRKERATRRKARVEKFMEKSGNYALAVREMPVEEILASEAHIRALAAYLRRHGVKLGQREAEVMVYLDLTQGRDPLDRIPPDRREHAGPGAGPRPARDSDGGSQSSSGDDSRGQDSTGQGSTGQEDWRDGPWDEDEDEDDNGDDGNGGGSDGGGGGSSGGGGGPWPFAPPGPARPGGRAPFPATINLLVPVGAAFGWSSMPGEAGRDIIDPLTLRELLQAASRHPATRWCVTLVEGRTAVAHGCARGRHTWDPPPDDDGTDKTAGHDSRASDPVRVPTAGQAAALAEFLARLKLSFEPIAKGTCDHRHAEPRYRPSQKLGHLTRARNAACPAPSCEASSWHSDMDHTQPWPEGPTDECNIGLTCQR